MSYTVAIFAGSDGSNGLGLWLTSGLPGGTFKLTDVQGANSLFVGLNPSQFTAFNGKVLFSGEAIYGHQNLWVTDGTGSGTHEIGPIGGAGPNGLDPFGLTPFNGQVYFGGADQSGLGLWKTDGTVGGTQEVTTATAPDSQVLIFNNKMLFASNGGYLWISDGTSSGTHSIATLSGFNGGQVGFLSPAILNGKVLFAGLNAVNVLGLWVTDGTSAGTHEITGIAGTYSAGLSPTGMTKVGNTVVFSGAVGQYDQELWVTDGTSGGTHTLVGVAGANTGTDGLDPRNLALVNGQVYFEGRNAEFNDGLWTTDGTVAGTHEIVGINGADAAGLFPSDITAFKGGALFRGYNAAGTEGLWFTDGTGAGTRELDGSEAAINYFASDGFTSFGVTELELTAAQAVAAYAGDPTLPPFTVIDTAANIGAEIDGLDGLRRSGVLSPITLTDPQNAVPVSEAQLAADAATLALITGQYNLAVTAHGDAFSYTLASDVIGLEVSAASSTDITGNDSFDTITLTGDHNMVQTHAGASIVIHGDHNVVLLGAAGPNGNTVYVDGSDNYLQGGVGSPADTFLAQGPGDATIYGGDGSNYVVSGGGRSTIVGGAGMLNTLYGQGSNGDYVVGGSNPAASNVLGENGSGGAQLWGGAGINYIIGGEVADLVVGGPNSDYLFGDYGNDTIYGGNGTDYIYPGFGDDFIWTDNFGSASTDYIYEGVATGTDTVADFTPGDGANHDVLVLTKAYSELTSFADVQAKAIQAGIYTVLPLSPTDQIYLYNVQPSQLTANDFIFT